MADPTPVVVVAPSTPPPSRTDDPPHILGIDHVSLQVTSVERSLEFYSTLGFSVVKSDSDGAGAHGAVWLASEVNPKVALRLVCVTEPTPSTVAFSVDSVSSLMHRLDANQTKWMVAKVRQVDELSCCDPDGNALLFANRADAWSDERLEPTASSPVLTEPHGARHRSGARTLGVGSPDKLRSVHHRPEPPPHSSRRRQPRGTSGEARTFATLQRGLSAGLQTLRGLRSRSPAREQHARAIDESDHSTPTSKSGDENVHPKRVAVLTSGGDSPGMNAAVRAVVRCTLYSGADAYTVHEGYQGLVDGGDKLRKCTWTDVGGIQHIGGTIIGSARCAAFRERPGRLLAAKHLVERGIDALIVIGGDGSLTGADLFKREWPDLLKELCATDEVDSSLCERHRTLTVAGLVGSIDNDMVGSDSTIGADSALNRIIEAVDAISMTAASHQRAFIIEVMGRRCGWLGLMAAMGTGADWLFIPEDPPEEGWEDRMCDTLVEHKRMGRRNLIVIVAEGAMDRSGKPITCSMIRDLLSSHAHLDTRVTILGHVQRGGLTSFNDRYLGTVCGADAVDAVLNAGDSDVSPVICMSENSIVRRDLMDCVRRTKQVGEYLDNQQWIDAQQARGEEFVQCLQTFVQTNNLRPSNVPGARSLRVLLIHTGSPCGGINAATRIAARRLLDGGHVPLAAYGGFAGLAKGDVREIGWMDCEMWYMKGGSELGINRSSPADNLGMVVLQLQHFAVDAILNIGSFEAFNAVATLCQARKVYPALRIPIVCIPAGVSNSVPGTDVTVGSDTALNQIVNASAVIKQSASASRRRVFVVDVMGGRCGYLATLAGLGAGATVTYVPEEGVDLQRLANDIEHLRRRFQEDKKEGRLVLRCEGANDAYSNAFICTLFQEESRGKFDVRSANLGHMQQGGAPSPLDRVQASRFAAVATDFVLANATPFAERRNNVKFEIGDETAAVVGFRNGHMKLSPVMPLWREETDHENRRPIHQWWLNLRPLLRVLAKYGFYDDEDE